MKDVNDDQVPLNHLNVVLQSLYYLCPLRAAVFKKSSFNSVPLDSAASSLKNNALELIFAKMHYDYENRSGPTDASIYFKDPTFYVSANPDRFYYLLTTNLVESEPIRNLIQWTFLTKKRTIETGKEVFFEDTYEIITVNLGTEKTSLQAYFDEEFLVPSVDPINAVIFGDSVEISMENQIEIIHAPVIAAFSLPRTLDSWPETPTIFNVEPVFTLANHKFYNLMAVILYDPIEDKFSVCLKTKTANTEESWWYRLQDDSIQRVSQESVLVSVSKFGYMVFYQEAGSIASFCDSPKPSQQLIMECLTKNTLHAISKTVKKKNSSSSPASGLKTSSAAQMYQKSKNMPHSDYFAFSSSLSGGYSNSPYGSTIRSSTSQMTLPSLPSKTPPPIELEQLKSILVPVDLSDTKLRLITTGSFSQGDDSIAVKPASKATSRKSSYDDDDDGFLDDYSGFVTQESRQSSDSEEQQNVELELEYFDENPRKSGLLKDSALLKDKIPLTRGAAFADLIDFDFKIDEPNPLTSHDEFISHKLPEDDAAEMFLKASLSHIRKSRFKDLNEEFGSFAIELKPIQSKRREKSKKASKSSAKVMKSAHSILSHGLFYRSTKTVLPVSSSEEDSSSKSEDEKEHKQSEQQQKTRKNVKLRYATL